MTQNCLIYADQISHNISIDQHIKKEHTETEKGPGGKHDHVLSKWRFTFRVLLHVSYIYPAVDLTILALQ